MRLAGLDQHELVHDRVEDIQPNFQQVQFVEERETVIYHAWIIP